MACNGVWFLFNGKLKNERAPFKRKNFIEDLNNQEKEIFPKLGFLEIIYLIRCNYFHGGKVETIDSEIPIIKWAYDSIKDFIEAYEKISGGLHSLNVFTFL